MRSIGNDESWWGTWAARFQIPRQKRITFSGLNGNYHGTLKSEKAKEPDGWEPPRYGMVYRGPSASHSLLRPLEQGEPILGRLAHQASDKARHQASSHSSLSAMGFAADLARISACCGDMQFVHSQTPCKVCESHMKPPTTLWRS